jgi:hypothetical protein
MYCLGAFHFRTFTQLSLLPIIPKKELPGQYMADFLIVF